MLRGSERRKIRHIGQAIALRQVRAWRYGYEVPKGIVANKGPWEEVIQVEASRV